MLNFQKYIKNPDIKLKDIQLEACDRMYNTDSILLAFSCGLGKTLVVLSTCESIRESEPDAKFIVIIPKSARSVFIKEFETKISAPFAIIGTDVNKKYAYTDQPYILIEQPQLEKTERKEKQFFYADFIAALRKETDNINLVIDEAHTVMTSPKTLRYRTIYDCKEVYRRKYLLTASPLLNSIDSLFFVYNFINNEKPFDDWFRFQYHYCILEEKEITVMKRSKFPGKPPYKVQRKITQCVGYKNLDELREPIMKNTILGSIVYDLTYDYIKFNLDNELRDEYIVATKGLKEGFEHFKESEVKDEDKVQHSARLVKLQNIVDGLTTDPWSYTCNKEKELMRLLKKITDSNEGAIIYADYKETVKRISELMGLYKDELNINNIYVISGEIKVPERIKVEKALTRRDVCIITRAGCVSINLQAVNHIILYNVPFSQADAEQSIGRICRCNSTYDKKYVHILECDGTIDTYKRILFQQLSKLVNQIFDNQHPTLPTDLIREDNRLRRQLKWSFLWKPKI